MCGTRVSLCTVNPVIEQSASCQLQTAISHTASDGKYLKRLGDISIQAGLGERYPATVGSGMGVEGGAVGGARSLMSRDWLQY